MVCAGTGSGTDFQENKKMTSHDFAMTSRAFAKSSNARKAAPVKDLRTPDPMTSLNSHLPACTKNYRRETILKISRTLFLRVQGAN